jgi:hypothetical protein
LELVLLSVNQNVCTTTNIQLSKLNMFATCVVLHQLDSGIMNKYIICPGDLNSVPKFTFIRLSLFHSVTLATTVVK